jgi:hypothetical protein
MSGADSFPPARRARRVSPPTPWALWARAAALRVGLWLMLVLPASAARAVIDVGAAAPPFTLDALGGSTRGYDPASTTPLMLVFVKLDDKYTSDALASLDEMFADMPALGRGLERWMIAARLRPGDDLARLKAIVAAHPGWTALLDRTDKTYFGYGIVATPTVVVIGREGKIAVTHPGFDLGMRQSVRLALAGLMGVALPTTATQTPEPPDMRLQMARRLAERRLYARALPFYRQLADAGALTGQARLEMADIYLQLNDLEPVQGLIDDVPTTGPLAAGRASIAHRLERVRRGEPDPGHHARRRLPTDPTTATRQGSTP